LPPRASTSGESTPGEETRQAIANAGGRYRTPKRTTPIVILFHAAFNSFTRFFLSELQGSHYVVAWWTLSGLVTLLAVAVVAYAGSQNLARGHTKPVYEQAGRLQGKEDDNADGGSDAGRLGALWCLRQAWRP
jgi:hypothetical protein